jgi:tyrosine-protein phosphatase YwqE
MFSIFNKKAPMQADFSGIRTDMHSHLLPGIDDGSPDADMSLTLIIGLKELGYQKFIATPHILSDMYPNDPDSIGSAKGVLEKALEVNKEKVPLHAAAEYYLDDHFSTLLDNKVPLLTLKDNYVLIEFPFVSPPYNYKEQIFQLQLNGYQPVLAHPERYTYFSNRKEVYDELKGSGCLFQTNLLSFTGYYGRQAQELANYFVKTGYIDLVGTDLHHERHLQALRSFGSNQTIINNLLHSGKLLNPSW